MKSAWHDAGVVVPIIMRYNGLLVPDLTIERYVSLIEKGIIECTSISEIMSTIQQRCLNWFCS